MTDLHDALEALADRWDRPNGSTWASSVAFAHDLRQVLAAHPRPTAPAPTGLREALAELADECDATNQMWGKAVASDVRRLLARFPAPVLPEGAVPLADGTHWCKAEAESAVYGDDFWLLRMPDCLHTIGAPVMGCHLRSLGQPVPGPAPQITVGCIVRTPCGSEWGYRGTVAIERPVVRSIGGWSYTLNDRTTADLSFVAPSRDAHGWPPIEEDA